jgi:hypothetical protein
MNLRFVDHIAMSSNLKWMLLVDCHTLCFCALQVPTWLAQTFRT